MLDWVISSLKDLVGNPLSNYQRFGLSVRCFRCTNKSVRDETANNAVKKSYHDSSSSIETAKGRYKSREKLDENEPLAKKEKRGIKKKRSLKHVFGGKKLKTEQIQSKLDNQSIRSEEEKELVSAGIDSKESTSVIKKAKKENKTYKSKTSLESKNITSTDINSDESKSFTRRNKKKKRTSNDSFGPKKLRNEKYQTKLGDQLINNTEKKDVIVSTEPHFPRCTGMLNGNFCDCGRPVAMQKVRKKRISRGVQYESPKKKFKIQGNLFRCFTFKSKKKARGKSHGSGIKGDSESARVIYRSADKMSMIPTQRKNESIDTKESEGSEHTVLSFNPMGITKEDNKSGKSKEENKRMKREQRERRKLENQSTDKSDINRSKETNVKDENLSHKNGVSIVRSKGIIKSVFNIVENDKSKKKTIKFDKNTNTDKSDTRMVGGADTSIYNTRNSNEEKKIIKNQIKYAKEQKVFDDEKGIDQVKKRLDACIVELNDIVNDASVAFPKRGANSHH